MLELQSTRTLEKRLSKKTEIYIQPNPGELGKSQPPAAVGVPAGCRRATGFNKSKRPRKASSQNTAIGGWQQTNRTAPARHEPTIEGVSTFNLYQSFSNAGETESQELEIVDDHPQETPKPDSQQGFSQAKQRAKRQRKTKDQDKTEELKEATIASVSQCAGD